MSITVDQLKTEIDATREVMQVRHEAMKEVLIEKLDKMDGKFDSVHKDISSVHKDISSVHKDIATVKWIVGILFGGIGILVTVLRFWPA